MSAPRAGQRDEALKALEQVAALKAVERVEEQGPMLKEMAIAEVPENLNYFRADPTADSLRQDPGSMSS